MDISYLSDYMIPVIVGLCLMAALFALRKLFAEGPEPPQIENT